MELIFLPGRIGLPAGSHPWTATWVTGLKSSGFTVGFWTSQGICSIIPTISRIVLERVLET